MPTAITSFSGSGGDGKTGDTLTASKYVYVGTHSRLVALDNGVKLEVLDDATGNWIEQDEWTE